MGESYPDVHRGYVIVDTEELRLTQMYVAPGCIGQTATRATTAVRNSVSLRSKLHSDLVIDTSWFAELKGPIFWQNEAGIRLILSPLADAMSDH